MKRWVQTVLALTIVAALGAYVAVYETKPKEEKKDRPWQVKAEDVVSFELQDLATNRSLSCGKEKDGSWWITAPQKLEADGEAVDQVARHLAAPEVERKLEAPPDLTPFGLTTPKFRASFKDKKGKAHVLLVGAKNPTDSAYFVLPEGTATPFTVATWSADSFRKTVNDLRQKTLLAIDPAKVTRIVIRRARIVPATIEIVRAGEAWKLAKPVDVAADRYAVEALLNDLKALKGSDVVEEAQAYSRYKLDQPGFEVVVYSGSGTGASVVFSKPNPQKDEAYASSSRLPFTFRLAGTWALQNIAKGVDDFRERLLLQMDKETVTAAEITLYGLTARAVKGKRDKWTITPPADAGGEFQDALFEAVYVRAESFVDDAPESPAIYGLAPPRATVTLHGVKDGKPLTVSYRLGNRSAETAYLQFGSAPSVYGVRKDLLDRIERFADKVRSAGAPAPAATPAKSAPATKKK
jgi:hypothetical protein